MDKKKEQYWCHYIKNKKYWRYGVTMRRLEKVKQYVWRDTELWDDILLRHSGKKYSPEFMKEIKPDIYKHMIGNMASMIYQNLIEHKIIKC